MKDNTGYVYLLKIGDSYKIGASKNLPDRMKSLQTGSVDDIKLEHTIYTDTPYQLEKQLHYRFKHKRIKREFFNLNNDDIVYIKNIKADWSNDHFLEKGRVANGSKDISGILSYYGVDVESMEKYKLPMDIEADLQISKIANVKDFSNFFKLLPYDNVWIEGKQHCRDYSSWTSLLQRAALVLFKLNIVDNTKFYNSSYFNFGVNFVRENDKIIRFTLFSSFEDSEIINLVVNGYIIHSVNSTSNINTILISQNKLIPIKCDSFYDCTLHCKRKFGLDLDCDVERICLLSQIMECVKKRNPVLLELKEIILSKLFNYKRTEEELSKIKITDKHIVSLCGSQKIIGISLIITLVRALEYLNQDTIHIIKSEPITNYKNKNKTESKSAQHNEWHLITNSNKVVYHYLHNDDTNKDRKSPISHWRRSHLRKLFNKIIRVRESFIGGSTNIDKVNNKIYTLIK